MQNDGVKATDGRAGTWYYERDGQRIGPFSEGDLPRLVAAQIICPATALVHENGRRMTVQELGLLARVGSATGVAPDSATTLSAESPADRLPPALACSPPPPPPPPAPAAGPQELSAPLASAISDRAPDDPRVAEWRRLRGIANWQGATTGVLVVGSVLAGIGKDYPILAVLVFVGLAWSIGKMAESLGKHRWLYTALALTPLSLLLFLFFFRLGNKQLRAAGIKAGFLGTELPPEPPDSFQPTDKVEVGLPDLGQPQPAAQR